MYVRMHTVLNIVLEYGMYIAVLRTLQLCTHVPVAVSPQHPRVRHVYYLVIEYGMYTAELRILQLCTHVGSEILIL